MFDNCHFGQSVMTEWVFVFITMKLKKDNIVSH